MAYSKIIKLIKFVIYKDKLFGNGRTHSILCGFFGNDKVKEDTLITRMEENAMKRRWMKVLAMSLAFCIGFSEMNLNVLADAANEAGIDENPVVVMENLQEDVWEGIETDIYEKDNYRVIFCLTESWEGGYNAEITVENTGVETIHNWMLKFDYSYELANIWNAEIIEKNGQTYLVKNVGWNQDIEAGSSISFGISGQSDFCAFPGIIG